MLSTATHQTYTQAYAVTLDAVGLPTVLPPLASVHRDFKNDASNYVQHVLLAKLPVLNMHTKVE